MKGTDVVGLGGGSESVVGGSEVVVGGEPDDEIVVGEAVSVPGGSEFEVGMGVGVVAGSSVTGSAPSPLQRLPHGSS